MKPNKTIEKLLGQLQYKSSPVEQDKVAAPIDLAWRQHEAKQKALLASRESARAVAARFAKLAAAVTVALLGLVVSIGILDKSTGPAYALEQTVEAVKDTRYFHFRYIDQRQNVDREAWVEYDQDGELKKVRVNYPKREVAVVWSNGITQRWSISADRNELSIYEDIDYTDQILSFANRRNPRNAVEYLRQREAKGDVRIEIGEPAERSDPIPVTVTYEPNTYLISKPMPPKREVLHVDPATKLLLHIDVYGLIRDSFVYNGVWEYLDYNQPFKPGIFDLEKEIGTDTTRFSTLGLDIGIEQGEMPERGIAVKVADEFLAAWKSKHYDRAVHIHGYTTRSSRDNLLQRLSMSDLLLVVEIGEPSPAEPPMRGYTLRCTLQTRRGSKTGEARWDIHVRRRTATRWCIAKVSVGDQPVDLRKSERPRAKGTDDESVLKAVDSNGVKLDLSTDVLVKVISKPAHGFNFPYYLFVPHTIDPNNDLHMLVETNNTGTTSDDFEIHDHKARRLAEQSYATKIARKLDAPLLVPTFPRPRDEQGRIYTHSLDEDTLLVKSGPLERIDLQLIQMIRDAQSLLRRNNIRVRDKVFMHGFSASGTFSNRFPILHPHVVRAVASGGVNGIPTFPTAQWRDTQLPFPVGIADLKQIADVDFDESAYKQVSQFIYMGYFDRNDTTLSRDTYCEEHARIIRTLVGADMAERWKVSQSIYRELDIPAQCVTYNGTAHTIRSEMIDDIAEFFKANSNRGFSRIEPHEYPFVEYKEIKVAHIKGAYWRGDEKIPEFARGLFEGKGDFIVTVEEWHAGQNHSQLNMFKGKVVFEFVLKADGHEDIRVTPNTFRGTCSSGRGDFQGFVVGLAPSEGKRIVSGVKYAIMPINQGDEYYWQVNDGVSLVRPTQ